MIIRDTFITLPRTRTFVPFSSLAWAKHSPTVRLFSPVALCTETSAEGTMAPRLPPDSPLSSVPLAAPPAGGWPAASACRAAEKSPAALSPAAAAGTGAAACAAAGCRPGEKTMVGKVRPSVLAWKFSMTMPGRQVTCWPLVTVLSGIATQTLPAAPSTCR